LHVSLTAPYLEIKLSLHATGGLDSDGSKSAAGIPKITYTNETFSIEPEVSVDNGKKKKTKKEVGADLR
jgi:hypothetical protein